MSRWEPNALGRLQEAAMQLYVERGFNETTVEDIAARAGLTERTFFRYFADKREVFFAGAEGLKKLFVDTITGALKKLSPLEAVEAALHAAASGFDERREMSHARHALITAHAELQERELIKLANFGNAMAEALRQRGVAEPDASLTAQTGIAVFRISFDRWVADSAKRGFAKHLKETLSALRKVTGPARASARSRTHRRNKRGVE